MEKKLEILEKIKSSQQPDGSFLIFTNGFEFGSNSPCATALVLFLLCEIEAGEEMELVKNKAFYYLLSQGDDWKFSLVDKKYNTGFLIEKELGTTFLALSSLVKYDQEILDGKATVGILKILTDCEVDEGGPYYSKTKKLGTNSINLMANILISNFLSLCEVNLEKLDQFVAEKIEPIFNQSQLLLSDMFKIYFLSKNTKKDLRERIITHLRGFLNGSENDPVLKHLAINCLVNLGESFADIETMPGFLDVSKNAKCEQFLPLGEIFDLKVEMNFSYELLNSLLQLMILEKKTSFLASLESGDREKRDAIVYETVVAETRGRFKRIGSSLEKYCNKTLDRVIGFDSSFEIGLLPSKFKESLERNGESIPESTVIALGSANFFLWMAYTVYDDFFDDEGDPKMLPVANFCQREFAAIYGELMSGNEDFKIIFTRILDNLDSANSWEVTCARTRIFEDNFYVPEKIPDYKNFSTLADRSLAHCLGPVAILVMLGFSHDSPEVTNLVDFFKHYLISRQLNDDSHDWEEDFKKGHVSGIVSAILEKLTDSAVMPSLTGTKIDLKKDFTVLQKYFWLEMLPVICIIVLQNIEKSKDCLKRISLVQSPDVMIKYLKLTEDAALKAIKEYKQAKEFLESYS